MNNSQFTLANRKQLADILKDDYYGLRYKAKNRWEEKAAALRKTFIGEHAEKKGALAVLRQIEAEEEKIHELKVELETLGFETEHGNLELHDRRSNPLSSVIERRVEKEIGPKSSIDARFDSAQISIMTVATLEDADKLLKSVSEI